MWFRKKKEDEELKRQHQLPIWKRRVLEGINRATEGQDWREDD